MKYYWRQVMIGIDAEVVKTLQDEEPVGYEGFGAPLYAHQIDSQGTE